MENFRLPPNSPEPSSLQNKQPRKPFSLFGQEKPPSKDNFKILCPYFSLK